jgi:lipase maturation factor 1
VDSDSVRDLGVPRPFGVAMRELFLPSAGPPFLWARWFFLRALGGFYLSAFYSLAAQIRGLIGDQGILPAREVFDFLRERQGFERYWTLPSLLWLAPGDPGLVILVVVGLVASLLLIANVWPRVCLVVCGVMFLSFITAARDFSSYQSEGMLFEATAAAFVLAPQGVRPGLGALHPPSGAARLLVLWECFRIYFESGVAKLASGDTSWRDMTAMDHYYENGPLPTWIGWWAHQLPHGFHAATAVVTLAVELVVVFGIFGPRRVRLVTFAVLTLLQAGIIATANYCFLNYLVLTLAVLCVDDEALPSWLRRRSEAARTAVAVPLAPEVWRYYASIVWILWLAYGTVAVFLFAGAPDPIAWLRIPAEPLAHLRLANRYGLFARMTNVRYEIELEGTTDGQTWLVYPFKYKPQALDLPPGIFAPYQPRFEWNLWFCAVDEEGVARRHIVEVARMTCPWVLTTEARLLERSPFVLALFREDPFHGVAPHMVRATLWRYWMTNRTVLRETGNYWHRERVGTYIDVAQAE